MIFNEDYYNYILERAGLYESEILNYSKLFHEMHYTAFRWDLVPMDENRSSDGISLRKQYTEETGEELSKKEPCSFLEMVVGLAIRCEVDVMHDGFVDNTREWFWFMLSNCGLIKYDNANWKGVKVKEIINNILFRRYMPDGRGSLFPLKSSVNDQRKVELWYQLHAWLHENYD